VLASQSRNLRMDSVCGRVRVGRDEVMQRTMTPDEQVFAVKAALAEAGYPDAVVWWNDDPALAHIGTTTTPTIPPGVWWRVHALLGRVNRCWPCYKATLYDRHGECNHDWRAEPWPPVDAGVS
jgi:hypothetical protein